MFESKRVLVFGCGNPLFGDDGFGPAVIEHLERHYGHQIGDHVAVLDVGTSIRDILFDLLLSPRHPERIVIVDAVDRPGHRPGDLFEIDVDEIPAKKVSDFSLHQFPTTNMLAEIRNATRIDVRILVTQTGVLPERVHPGLSSPVRDAIPVMCRRIVEVLQEGASTNSKGKADDRFSGQQTGQGHRCAPQHRYQLDSQRQAASTIVHR